MSYRSPLYQLVADPLSGSQDHHNVLHNVKLYLCMYAYILSWDVDHQHDPINSRTLPVWSPLLPTGEYVNEPFHMRQISAMMWFPAHVL